MGAQGMEALMGEENLVILSMKEHLFNSMGLKLEQGAEPPNPLILNTVYRPTCINHNHLNTNSTGTICWTLYSESSLNLPTTVLITHANDSSTSKTFIRVCVCLWHNSKTNDPSLL